MIDVIAPRVPFLTPGTTTVSREWYSFLNQARTQANGIAAASVITFANESALLPNSRVLATVPADLVFTVTDTQFLLGLADTGVTVGAIGDASHTLKITFDAKGRATAVQSYVLNTDNITEGAANLFFTVSRARASISSGTGINYVPATGVINIADTAVAPGAYGNASHVASFTVDQQGRLTAAGQVTITIAAIIGMAPAADGTYANPTSITIKNGVIVAIS